MAQTLSPGLAAFLADLRVRHAERVGFDHAYERMMYQTESPPTPRSLSHITAYLHNERDDGLVAGVPSDAACRALGPLLQGMRWPDPSPLSRAADLLPGWDTLHVSTLLHSIIPDYPIWGAPESRALAGLGLEAPYVEGPGEASEAYGAYMRRIKDLREAARSDQVPESHHYLTRIVQAALEELGRRGS